jgi:hypothetical protein
MMKAALKLEWIGAEESRRLSSTAIWGGPPLRKPWVAELTELYTSGKPVRRFVDSHTDYRSANAKGSRGVFLTFILETDRLYNVHEYISWKRSHDYLCAVSENGDIVELTNSEATEWLKNL